MVDIPPTTNRVSVRGISSSDSHVTSSGTPLSSTLPPARSLSPCRCRYSLQDASLRVLPLLTCRSPATLLDCHFPKVGRPTVTCSSSHRKTLPTNAKDRSAFWQNSSTPRRTTTGTLSSLRNG